MIQKKKVLAGIALGATLSAPVPALAEINWNGFMTVGAGMTLDRAETYAGYDNNLSFEPDTLLGLQAQSDLGENLSVTGQLLARAENDSVEAEWLYLSYQATPSLRLNFGRQRLPFFLYSDYLDVGYAYHFLRPPISVYDLPFSSIDGLSAIHTLPMGDFELATQVIGGSYEVDSGFDSSSNAQDSQRGARVEDYAGINLTLTYNYWLTMRASYHRANLELIENDPTAQAQRDTLLSTLAQLGRDDVIDAYEGRLDYTFGGLAVQMEKNGYLLIAEGTYTEVESIGFEYLDYYISAGKRFGSFLPYVTFERQESDMDRSLYAGLPAQLAQPLLEGVTQQSADARTYSIGTRYDFHPSAALKVEVTKFNDQRDSNAPGFSSKDATLLSLAVSTVF
jgi:hypothetical protein